MSKEKELLRKQLQLLAEQSAKAYPDELEGLTQAMCDVYRELVVDSLRPMIALLLVSGLHLSVSIFVHIKKLLRRDA